MANKVEFQDFSFNVKAKINSTTIGWLHKWANEMASHAQRNCKTDYEEGMKQLKGSYKAEINETKGEALVGTPLEAGYWEEFGTGEYADTSKNGGKPGREGWWVYTPDTPGPPGYKSNTYYDEMEAMMMAAHIQSKYNKKAYVSNGQRPNYTLEKAFNANKEKAKSALEKLLKEMEA